MAKKNAAQRANQKNAKANKRKKALAKRQDPVPSAMKWKPLTEGIEGLARRLKLTTFHAAALAPIWLRAVGAPATAVWTADRLQAHSTGDILEMLGARGVQTDAESFATRALDLLSTLRFAEADWLPELAAESTVHDRDLIRAANVELWERWLPDTAHDEEIDAVVLFAGASLDTPKVDSPLHELLATYESLGDEPARRLLRHPNGEEFVRVLLDALWAAYESGELDDGSISPEDEEAALAALDLLVPAVIPELLPELAPLREALAGDPEEAWDDDDDDLDKELEDFKDPEDPPPDEPGT